MPPAAVLKVLVEAAGIAKTNAALMKVHETLQKVDGQVGQTQRAVEEFGRAKATAKVAVDTSAATEGVAKATAEVRHFDGLTATARADIKISGAEAQIEILQRKLLELGAKDQSVEVRVATAKALIDLERVEKKKRELETSRASVGVEVKGATQATADLNAVKTAADRVGSSVAGVGDGGRRGGSGLGFLSGAASVLPQRLSALGASALFLAPALLAIVGPAVAVASALAPLIGLAAGAGGALVAAAQGFGVFKLASAGVSGALKEQLGNQTSAGAGAVKQAGQEVSAARAIRSAQESVRAAREGVKRAADALTEAQRTERSAVADVAKAYAEARQRIRDMRTAVVETTLALGSAAVKALEARRALSALLTGPSPRILADAHRDISDALRDEAGAALELLDAQNALNGILAGANPLDHADAVDAVSDALRDQEHAQLALNAQLAATNAVLADPLASSDAIAQARLELADAQNAVGDATRGAARAQAALSALEAAPTQEQIARARLNVASAEAAVAAARTQTEDATAALRAVEAGSSALEVFKARLDLADAEQSVNAAIRDQARAVKDFTTAQATGLAQAKEVVGARESLRQATRGVTQAEDALADANRQVAEALRGVSEAQQDAAQSAAAAVPAAANLNKEFDALSPAAQAFVRQLMAMKPKLDELRATAASGFFPGATEGLKAAMGSFDNVNRVVAITATTLGDLAKRAGELVGSGPFGKDIETIGASNARALDSFGGAGLHLVSALRHVLVVAGPLVEWMGKLAEKWALSAAEAAKAGRESGKLAAFFERTRDKARELGSIIGHLAHGLLGLGRAGTGSGNDILASIDRASKRFDEWANSAAGQSKLRDFFRETKELAAALVPVIAGVATGMTVLSLKLLPLTTALRVLGPLADELTIAFIGWKVAATAAAFATGALNLAMKSAFIARQLATAFWALNAAMAANPIGLVVVAIAALVAGLIYAYKHSETFRDIVDGAFKAVGVAAEWMWGAIKTVFNAIVGVIRWAWGLIFGDTKFTWENVKVVLTAVWEQIKTNAKTAWEFIRNFIINPIKEVATWLVPAIRNIVVFIGERWEDLKRATADAWGFIKSYIVTPISEAISWIRTAVADVATWLGEKWDGVSNTAAKAWRTVKNAIITPITEAFSWAKEKITDFIDIGKDIIGGIVRGIRSAGEGIWDALKSIVSSAMDRVKGLLGISSPSKVFAEIGSNVGQGMATGITNEHAAVMRAIASMVDVPTALAGTSVSMDTAAPAGPGTWSVPQSDGDMSVEIVVKGDGDLERVIAGMIDVRIKRNGRDIAATWKAGKKP